MFTVPYVNLLLSNLKSLYNGEEIKRTYTQVRATIVGGRIDREDLVMSVSNYQLHFIEKATNLELQESTLLFALPIMQISRIKKDKKKKLFLELSTKDGRHIWLNFHKKDDRKSAYDTITTYAFPDSCFRVFAYVHGACASSPQQRILLQETEYKRLGFCNEYFRMVHNEEFKLCSTYPEYIVLPSEISDELIEKVAGFRSRKRIPAIVWKHPKNGALLIRCAQPCVGINMNHCDADAKLLSFLKVGSQDRIVILDSRPKANAVANMLRGGGYEMTMHYHDTDLEFCDIENIHAIRNNLQSLFQICEQATSSKTLKEWQKDLHLTQWFTHIRLIIKSALRAVEILQGKGHSVIVHCSDGWDRTAQTISLTELLLDPYYRTIEGFLMLIEKEWLQFGHQFALRYGHAESSIANYKESQRSPIFPQWLDVVWQLTEIFPTRFEFTESLLLRIMDELHTCLYGTFLYNSQKQRIEKRVYEETSSLWDAILLEKDRYLNPKYRPKSKHLYFDLPRHSFKLWTSYYLRWKEPTFLDGFESGIYEDPKYLGEAFPQEPVGSTLSPRKPDNSVKYATVSSTTKRVKTSTWVGTALDDSAELPIFSDPRKASLRRIKKRRAKPISNSHTGETLGDNTDSQPTLTTDSDLPQVSTPEIPVRTRKRRHHKIEDANGSEGQAKLPETTRHKRKESRGNNGAT